MLSCATCTLNCVTLFHRQQVVTRNPIANAKISARQPWYIGHNSLNQPSLAFFTVIYTSISVVASQEEEEEEEVIYLTRNARLPENPEVNNAK